MFGLLFAGFLCGFFTYMTGYFELRSTMAYYGF